MSKRAGVRLTSSVTWRHRQHHFVKEYEWVGGRRAGCGPLTWTKAYSVFLQLPSLPSLCPKSAGLTYPQHRMIGYFPLRLAWEGSYKSGVPKVLNYEGISWPLLFSMQRNVESVEVCEMALPSEPWTPKCRHESGQNSIILLENTPQGIPSVVKIRNNTRRKLSERPN